MTKSKKAKIQFDFFRKRFINNFFIFCRRIILSVISLNLRKKERMSTCFKYFESLAFFFTKDISSNIF